MINSTHLMIDSICLLINLTLDFVISYQRLRSPCVWPILLVLIEYGCNTFKQYSHWLYTLKECCNAFLSERTLLWLLTFSQLLSYIFYWGCKDCRHFCQQRLAVVHASCLAASFSCHKPFETTQLLISDTRNDFISCGDSNSNSNKKNILTCFLDQLACLRVIQTLSILTCTLYSYQIYLCTSLRYAVG